MHAAVPGTELRALRKALGVSLAQLAEGIVTVGFLSSVETGQKLIHKDKLAALLQRLDEIAQALPAEQSHRVVDSLHARLRAAISKGQREEAESLRDELRRRSLGDEPQLMLAEGQVEASFGDPGAAYRYLQAAIWRLPKPSDEWFRAVIDFCQLCTEIGKESEGAAVGVEAVELAVAAQLPPDLELELRATVSGALCNSGNPQGALAIVAVTPEVLAGATDWGRVTALWAQANAFNELGDFDRATARGNEALQLLAPLHRDLTLARLRNTVASFEIQRHSPDWDHAEELLRLAAETHRRLGTLHDLGQTLGTMGDMWSRRGEESAALEAFAEALAHVPDSAGALKACVYLERATALLRVGQPNDARAELQSAQSLLGADAGSRYHSQLWHRLAMMFEQAGDLSAALICIKEAAKQQV